MSTTDFFHGVQVVEITNGPRSIRTLASSTIGLVGTAPNAQVAAAASLIIGTTGAHNALQFTANQAGASGNNISLQIRVPSGANVPFSISVNGNAITVFLATGATAGVATTTATALIAALAANAQANALITAADYNSSTGAGVVPATVQTFLSGGIDAIAPINVPTLITSGAQIGLFGTTGTLPAMLKAIYDNAEASVVVVRVTPGSDDAGTQAAIIGGDDGNGNYTGLKALLGAEHATGLIPRIIVAAFSNVLAVAQEMLVEATKLKAIAIISGPNTTDSDAVAYANNFGDARLYMVDPQVQVYDDNLQQVVEAPADAYVAGVIVANDAENGFWWSPSNREILNIVGTARPVDFSFNDPNCRANYLNSFNIATIIRQNGFRLWGNRTLSLDPAFAFLSVRRTADLIEDSVQRAHLWAVDRNISKAYFQEVTASVQGYLDSLKALGAILDGSIVADPDLNTPANLAAGKVYFDISFTPPAPAEQVTFRVFPTSTTGFANILS